MENDFANAKICWHVLSHFLAIDNIILFRGYLPGVECGHRYHADFVLKQIYTVILFVCLHVWLQFTQVTSGSG